MSESSSTYKSCASCPCNILYNYLLSLFWREWQYIFKKIVSWWCWWPVYTWLFSWVLTLQHFCILKCFNRTKNVKNKDLRWKWTLNNSGVLTHQIDLNLLWISGIMWCSYKEQKSPYKYSAWIYTLSLNLYFL
jgi:hypothetical protein